MNELTKYHCIDTPSDYTCVRGFIGDGLQVQFSVEDRFGSVILTPEDARAFAADIIQLADQIDSPSPSVSESSAARGDAAPTDDASPNHGASAGFTLTIRVGA